MDFLPTRDHQNPSQKRRPLPTGLFHRFMLAIVLLLAACAPQPAAATTDASEPAIEPATATASPTETPTQVPTPTETAFPYELPPLPSLEGITITQLAECDLSIVIGDETGYFVVAKDAQGKQYIIPNPRYIKVEDYVSCDMYAVEGGNKSLDANRIALAKAVLNMRFTEGNENSELVIEDYQENSFLDGFGTTVYLWGKSTELLPWFMKAEVRGLMFVKIGEKEIYFFTSKTPLTQEIIDYFADNPIILSNFESTPEEVRLFGLYNMKLGKIRGKVSEDELTYQGSEYIPSLEGHVLITQDEKSSWQNLE